MKGTIVIDKERCKECGYCALFCSKGLIEMSDKINSQGYHPAMLIDPEGKCTGCGICYLVCPDVAIEVYRETKAEEKVQGGDE